MRAYAPGTRGATLVQRRVSCLRVRLIHRAGAVASGEAPDEPRRHFASVKRSLVATAPLRPIHELLEGNRCAMPLA